VCVGRHSLFRKICRIVRLAADLSLEVDLARFEEMWINGSLHVDLSVWLTNERASESENQLLLLVKAVDVAALIQLPDEVQISKVLRISRLSFELGV
jgi:hypothetical protein